MRKGSTPIHTFTFPFAVSTLEKLSITYAQNGKSIIKKSLDDCTTDGNSVSVTLSQEETLSLDPSFIVKIQVKVLTAGGQVLTSDIIQKHAYECLDSEVLE